MGTKIIAGGIKRNVNEKIGGSKEYVSGASAYPPDLEFMAAVDILDVKASNVACINTQEIINQIEKDRNVTCGERDWKQEASQYTNFKIMQDRTNIRREIETYINCNIELLEYNPHTVQDVECNVNGFKSNMKAVIKDEIIIPQSRDKWWIRVPIRKGDKSIEWIQLLADPGANVGCINTAYAIDAFPKFIVKNTRTGVIKTPSGHVWPKYALWLKFPCKNGLVYAARFLLLDNLPAPILADINMLRAFGYTFKDEVPPVFKHYSQPAEQIMHDLDVKMEQKYKINKPVFNVNNIDLNNQDTSQIKTNSLFENYRNAKIADIRANFNIKFYDKISSIETVLYEESMLQALSNTQYADLSHAINYLNIENIEIPDANIVEYPIDFEAAIQKLDQVNAAAELQIKQNQDRIHQNRRLLMPEVDEIEECVMEIDDLDPYHIYDVWIHRLKQVDKIGGDLDTRNRNLCLLINNIDPATAPVLTPEQQRTELLKSGFDSDTVNIIQQHMPQYDPICMQQSHINFISSPNHILATPEEIEEAKNMHKNAKLKFNDLTYLLELERKFPIKYKDLYKKTKELIEKYKFRIFALYTYDRRTMKLQNPVRLGLKDEYRTVTHYKEQYPLSKLKRLAMINETLENDRNGFWIPIETSQHNIPYTVIAKKPDSEGWIRHRAAFDARSINQFCELIKASMPTMRNFDDFFAKRGLITLADFKNFFDCIPLDERDWPYAVVQTPLGLRMMTHSSYGWKNSAPNAQNITNEISAMVPGMLGYIDDIAIKHREEAGTDELLEHLETFFLAVEKYQGLLHPEKFFPFASEVESLGVKRTSVGSELTEKYKKKILGIDKPKTTDELRAAIGVIQYIGRYIYMHSVFAYWLVILVNEFEGKPQIKWTPEADYAWAALMELVQNAPILHHPTQEGQFCIKCDGCQYAVGAVLYQWQCNQETKVWDWVIVDMYSKIIPQSQRFNHCILSEALAILWPAQHWVIHLLRAPFLIATDHKALMRVFAENTDLTPNLQKQLLRIRLGLSDFEFEIRHVAGVDNKLPDVLSRLGAKLFELSQEHPITAYKSADIKNQTITETEIQELNLKLKKLNTKKEILKDYKRKYKQKGASIDGVKAFINDACNLTYCISRRIIDGHSQPIRTAMQKEITNEIETNLINYEMHNIRINDEHLKHITPNISEESIAHMHSLMQTHFEVLNPIQKHITSQIKQIQQQKEKLNNNNEFTSCRSEENSSHVLTSLMTRQRNKMLHMWIVVRIL